MRAEQRRIISLHMLVALFLMQPKLAYYVARAYCWLVPSFSFPIPPQFILLPVIYVWGCPDPAGELFMSGCGDHTIAWAKTSSLLWGAEANFVEPATYTMGVERAHFFPGCLWGHMVHLSMLNADAESKHRK